MLQQFFQELEMVIDQNQIDKLFFLEINSFDFSLITSVEDSFNLRIFFLILETF
jgi:6-pyruvoyl-tetrahydropterin synthase